MFFMHYCFSVFRNFFISDTKLHSEVFLNAPFPKQKYQSFDFLNSLYFQPEGKKFGSVVLFVCFRTRRRAGMFCSPSRVYLCRPPSPIPVLFTRRYICPPLAAMPATRAFLDILGSPTDVLISGVVQHSPQHWLIYIPQPLASNQKVFQFEERAFF